jgi:hypothetical protein
VDQDLLGDLVADAQDRVQRRQRILEDHRQLLAAQPAQFVVRGADQLAVAVAGAAGRHGVRRAEQSDQTQCRDRLPAAGLPDQREDLTGRKLQRDAVDGPRYLVLALERDREVADGK